MRCPAWKLISMTLGKTGFRSSLGGYQEVSGVRPDLSTFGKAFANGFPIAALAGKCQYMNLAISDDPSKRVLIAGTYNSQPIPVAAGSGGRSPGSIDTASARPRQNCRYNSESPEPLLMPGM